MATIYIETTGCQMNEADSRYLAERAVAAGFRVADRPDAANVLVLNTCTVRDNAEQRAYGRLSQFKRLKNADPTMKVAVCGCLAEQDREILRERLPHVDVLFGTKELPALGDVIASWAPDFADDEVLEERALLAALEPAQRAAAGDAFALLRAYVNVQYGCSYYCTYCIVPHVRGRFEHRPLGEVLDEVARRVREGAREVTLVGQTVNAYVDPDSGADFATLLETIAAAPGVERVGFITSHPKDLTPRLIEAFARTPRLNPRFHLALQSGSNPILRKMNRKYTIESYLEKIDAFRAACPDWALTTDMIVGFPGESDDDFERSLAVIERGLFAQVYSFIYSPRRGTPAARMQQIDPDVASARLQRLMVAVNDGVTAYHRRKLGTRVRGLVCGPSRKDRAKISIKTPDNVTVVAPYSGDANALLATPWIDVAVESAHVWGCAGRIVGVSATVDGEATEMPAEVIDLTQALASASALR